jgi:flagellar basal-body rod protein FlgG
MLEGLYSAAAGMEAQQQALDALSNDMSNMDTPGYQGAIVGFRDLLYTSGGNSTGSSIATGAGATASLIGRSQVQGSIQPTGQPLDVAINGTGYLEVTRPDGTIGLTRNGVLQIDAAGQLTNSLGMPLQPPITLPKGATQQDVKIGTDGTVSVNGRTVGKIQIVTVPAPDQLLADGNSVFSATTASGAIGSATGSTLVQGSLESSNVNVNDAMAQMMMAQQSYSMASKAVQYQDQMMQIADQVKK